MKITKPDVLKILSRKPLKRHIAIKGKVIPDDMLLLWFAYYELDYDKLKEALSKHYSRMPTVRQKVKWVRDLVNKHKINLDDIKQVKAPPPPMTKEEKTKKNVKKIVDRYSSLFNLLRISTKEVEYSFTSNKDGRMFSEEVMLKDLEEIYAVTVAKAKGELPTRTISTNHFVDEDKNGMPVYKLKEDDNGKKSAYIITQTHLPDERAIAMIPVIKELYDMIKGGNQALATNDELAEEYARLISKTLKDKEQYRDIEYTDAQLVEED